MALVRRLLLGLIGAAAAVRACAYLVYAAAVLPTPLEAFFLEAKMVLLAYRARTGESLYPPWHDYPHVTNFFGPVYFALVGSLGAVCGADIPGLFAIGRALSFLSALGTAAVVWCAAGRRYGRAAATTGALLTLGVGPLIGYSVMVRPDTLADLLGFGGFLLSGARRRWAHAAGGGLLVAAILTKQTTALYFAAAVLAPALAGERRRALGLLAGGTVLLAAVVAGVNTFLEPNFAASLLGESKTPWTRATLVWTVREILQFSPDLFFLPAVGVWLWLAPGSRDVRLATLAVVLLAGNVLAAGKYGAAPNYYLGLRGVEGLAAGALWRAARAAEGRARWAALGAWAALVPMLLLSLGGWAVGIHGVQSQAAFLASPQGRSYLRVHQALLDKARDPAARILTDSGMIDLYQGSRAAFGDPWLFRVMVDTGRIDPVTMKRRIDDGYYDLVVTTSDLDAPKYATFDRALPAVLAERVRKRYEPAGTFGELHFYSRRGERPAPLGTRP